jgi:hypothetical protein
MHAWQVVFSAPKLGNAEPEWEDGAAASPSDRTTGRGPRFAVADGATQGFGSTRWAMRLVEGFVGQGAPALTKESLHRWARLTQDRWRRDPVLAEATDLQLFKLETVGSFATFLGCEFVDLDGPRPKWTAAALGDTVLFQVRGNDVVAQFPPIPADGFGYNPDGLPTGPKALADMVERLLFAEGGLVDGDVVYLATDALADWMVRTNLADRRTLWALLAGLDHPDRFRALVDDRRRAEEMTNDDVTLMRVSVGPSLPQHLVVCL